MQSRESNKMVDIVDRKTRSRMMSKIKGKNTKPEVAVRQYLHRKGYRFRLHRKDLPGNPDIVLPSRMIAIFVHGCFWHRHRGCKKTTTPSTNRAFWERKFKDNVNRDERNTQALQKLGWAVMVIWECEVNDQGLETIAAKVESIPQKMKMSSTKRT
ncbi:very short patch repair endonuclease [Pseudodesulfovibrio profundus]|nr:very short patch repair endonuclease [Pseudodesulfovibrio profundus]